ncbi:S-layer domain protein [Desulfofarcimen acetoxidans DSM 771]|uniref:S-layer domain protein n=1 Tax=Desulfofarcimen acetoxidans (strain ATCC 49208 / DSM 771 / KCTC 5769 / VKM B-1644 / 5575) TaxID=485916 RepID=C8VY50_DESAS|nr:S-layer homology domain-containing protein [Desulfofarcimen acetoxidans]ACV64679.1 S-layer domain protein [Desulfofarcimen acetoxidans DSM 771]
MQSSKRVFIIALAVCLLLGVAGSVMAGELSDISGHWANNQINSWLNQGLVFGYPDGTFKPDKEMSRAEFVALVNRSFKIQNSNETNSFTDVKTGDWFSKDVEAARVAGYISGYEDNTFRPDRNISRQEVAVIVTRLLKLDTAGDLTELDKFADRSSIPSWSQAGLNAAVKNGIINGYPDKTVQPFKAITRAEAIVCLNAAIAKGSTTVEKSGIEGKVTYKGSAVKDAAVKLFDKDGFQVIKQTTTDAKGLYKLEVDPGVYDLTATTDKTVGYASDVSAAADKITAQDLTLEDGAIITGRLNNKNNNAAANVEIMFTTNPTFVATTNSSGQYKLVVLPDRQYAVRAMNPSNGEVEVIDDNVTVGSAGQTQTMSTMRASFATTSSGGGGGGGGGGSSQAVLTTVNDINKTTVEVSFNQALSGVQASDFTFSPSLNVVSAVFKNDAKQVVVLTLAERTLDTDYKLYYKGTDTGFIIKVVGINITEPVGSTPVPINMGNHPAEVTLTASVGGQSIPLVIDLPTLVSPTVAINPVTIDPGLIPADSLALDIVISGLGDKEVILTLPVPAGLTDPGAFHWNGEVWDYRESTISGGKISFATNLSPVMISNRVKKPVLKIESVTQNSVEMSWTTTVVNPKGFDLYRDGAKINAAMLDGTARGYNDTGLTPGKTYAYTIVVYNAQKCQSPKADTVTATTLADQGENAAFDSWLNTIKSQILLLGAASGNLTIDLGSATEPTTVTITNDSLKTKSLSDLLMSVIDKMVSRNYDNVVITLQGKITEINVSGKPLNEYIADKLAGKPHSAAAIEYFTKLDEASFNALKTALKNDAASYNELSATVREVISFSTEVNIPAMEIKGLTLNKVTFANNHGTIDVLPGDTISINQFKTALGINSSITLGSLSGSVVTLEFKGASGTVYDYEFNLN